MGGGPFIMKKDQLQEDRESINILKNWVTAFDKAIETKEQIIQKVHNVFGDNELVFNQPDYIDIYWHILFNHRFFFYDQDTYTKLVF